MYILFERVSILKLSNDNRGDSSGVHGGHHTYGENPFMTEYYEYDPFKQ